MKRLYTVTLLLFTLAATARGQATEKKDSTTMSRDLSEIVVTSEAKAINLPTIGVEKVRIQEMRKVPSLFGERDIIRSLQLLPGVKAESDGSSGFQVRGGKAGQNHILLNDATVYNSGHMMGLFSTFNDAVLAQADLYKSTPPAQFGGGSSSVLNVITKKGGKKFAISGTVGLLSAKLCADIPIGDKVTAFVAARRTYFDLFLKMVKKYRGTVMNFYDINAQVTYTANANNRLNVSFFRGRDNMGMDDLMDSGWDNTLGNVSYRHDFNDAHMMNTSVFLSSYGYDSESDMADVENKYGTAIKHVGLKQSFAWTPSHRLTLNYGFQSKLNDLLSLRIFSQSLDRKEQRRAWENDLWVSADWKPSTRLSVLAGMRLNLFSVLGGAPYYELDSDGNIIKTLNYGKGEIVKTHYTIEPRVSGNLKLNETSSIKAGYAITGQNIRPLYNNGMATVFNRYTMSSNIIKPEVAHQVSVGYAKMLCDDNYELQAEAYYKTIDNVLDYKDGMKFSSEIEAERIILSGRGRSYGLELMGRKRMGKLTGWVSYTLSWTENKIDGINNGKWYTASNDRRHDISIVGIYDITPKWQVSASWVFLSGQAMSVPSAKYEINGETIYYYNERNGYRAPAYHRLDVSASYKRQHVTKRGRKWSDEWTFGIYNLYNRYNPFTITFKSNSTYPTGTKAKLTALFGIMPSVAYNFYF
ncbi:MAG: TonB-dependent receptor [Muribaculaceae bacterium]|nr:TonB-dependent receptor [Muribaculaceae bacterium]